MMVGMKVAPLPDRFPVVEPSRHHRESGQVHDGAGTIGVEQRRGTSGADLGAVLDDAVLRVGERVEGLALVVQHLVGT